MRPKRTTLKDVAAHVGVHYSTVSRALAPQTDYRMSPELRERVHQAVAELKYRHNAAAVSLRTNSSKTIGILVPDITNPLFGPIIKGVDKVMSEQGYVALIGDTCNDPERERTLVSTFLTRGIEGLIVASALHQDEVVSAVSEDGTPIVTVNSRVQDKTVSSVGHNAKAGFGEVMTLLTQLGHVDIAYISGPPEWSTSKERMAAFKHWCKRCDITINEKLVIYADEYNEENGVRGGRKLVDQGLKFTAVVGANDLLAMGAMSALQEMGIECPKQVSVVGFNDIPMAQYRTPPLTTVKIDPYLAGIKAAEILFADIQLPAEARRPKHILLPVSLVVRASTASARRTPKR